ncbi:hypothetical protein BOTBODRAFT_38648, partial [Botryobasidium botryosum FD-172 SS1]
MAWKYKNPLPAAQSSISLLKRPSSSPDAIASKDSSQQPGPSIHHRRDSRRPREQKSSPAPGPENLASLSNNVTGDSRVKEGRTSTERQAAHEIELLRKEMELNSASRGHNLTRLARLYLDTTLFPSHPDIQDYEIQKVASMSDRGGFGECYKGIFLNCQEVAMKCLRVRPQPSLNTNESLEKRMDKMIGREVHVWRKLQHPNILPLIGLCTLESVTYMVSPWMANGNAFDYVRNNPGADRLLLLAQAADGLKFLHDFSPAIVHGDVRGPNVLISASGTACIADFGLSHVVEEASKFSYSTSWKYAGNFAWMAPELLGDDPPLRSRDTDVFSFGRMIVELTTGEQPFSYLPSPGSIVLATVTGKMPKKPEPGSVAHELGDEIWALAEECYRTKPRLRPPMTAVASRIWAIRSSRRIASFATGQPSPPALPRSFLVKAASPGDEGDASPTAKAATTTSPISRSSTGRHTQPPTTAPEPVEDAIIVSSDQPMHVHNVKFPKVDMGREQGVVLEIDKTHFEDYIKAKAAVLKGIINCGILGSGMDWYDAPPPTEIRSYIYEALRFLVDVHAHVSRAARSLLERTISSLVEDMSTEVLICFRQIRRFGISGMMQAALEIEFMYQVLAQYATASTHATFAKTYTAISAASSRKGAGGKDQLQRELDVAKEMFDDSKRAAAIEFLCFKAPRTVKYKRVGNNRKEEVVDL